MTQTVNVSAIPAPDFIKGPNPKGMLIGGEWTQAQSGETFETVNPATGSVLATIASGGAADVDRAVAAARRAFEKPSWADMNPHERTLVLLRIADAILRQVRARAPATLPPSLARLLSSGGS